MILWDRTSRTLTRTSSVHGLRRQVDRLPQRLGRQDHRGEGPRCRAHHRRGQRSTAYKEITDYVLHNGPYVVLYQPTERSACART